MTESEKIDKLILAIKNALELLDDNHIDASCLVLQLAIEEL